MKPHPLAGDISGLEIFLVGIKGTGTSAMAEILKERGARVGGSDTGESFYTDSILQKLGISYFETFNPDHIHDGIDYIVYSSAYPRDSHPELVKAAELRIPLLTYPQALGALSTGCDATGITGMHGKSSTTALAGTLAKALDLPASVVAGTAVSTFGGTSTLTNGTRFLIAETCEYKRHFLSFHPEQIVVTNVELEHTDYFSSIEDVDSAFLEYALRLPPDGTLIYCADDSGACRLADSVSKRKPGVRLVPYGEAAEGRFRITSIEEAAGEITFSLEGYDKTFSLFVPGRHNVLNATAAFAAVSGIVEKERGGFGSEELQSAIEGICGYRGSRRRSEIVGEKDGVLFLDDYGHHPTEIKGTLAGYKSFYTGRRMVVDFMPHLFSRTADLFDDFVTAFDAADLLVMHRIYASARETTGTISGKDLYEAIKERGRKTVYFHEVMDAEEYCRHELKEGDVFITMGAGDNWRLGAELARS